MSTEPLDLLDQVELTQLGLAASQAGDAGRAIAYWKCAAGRADASALVHFLLGSEYAQAGLGERAAGAFEAALALDPGMHLARLQLGLLWLTLDRADAALGVLAALAELGPEQALYWFGQGLAGVAQGRLDEADAALAAGMLRNLDNAALNQHIGAVRASIAQQAGAAGAGEVNPFLLSAYQKH